MIQGVDLTVEGFFGVGDSDGDGGSAIAISAVWSDRSASVGVG